MAEDDEPVLSRWSRLKREAKGAKAVAPERSDPPATAPEAAAPAKGDAAPAIRPEDLPDVESLTYESDFTVFLRDGVPAHLRRLALRKLWRSDPVLANVDGLNDYDDDYRAAFKVADIAREMMMRDKEGKRDRWATEDPRAKPRQRRQPGQAERAARPTPEQAAVADAHDASADVQAETPPDADDAPDTA